MTETQDLNEVLNRACKTSEQQLNIMREQAKELLGGKTSVIIGVNGSIARREMTSGSDVDLFVLSTIEDLKDAEEIQRQFRERLKEKSIKMPASGGVFEKPLPTSELTSKIGGEDDTNTFITRRMLYLLEGEWIANQTEFETLRRQLIMRYVPEDLDDHKFCRFLLNDIIRYWRTICVDFEHKTADATKPRAIRLIKLRFSRMMLYFGGVAAIRETAELGALEKREKLIELLSKPPIERIRFVFGEPETQKAMNAYAVFLQALDDKSTRDALSVPGSDGLETQQYKDLCDKAREFRDELQGLLLPSGAPVNDIATALMF